MRARLRGSPAVYRLWRALRLSRGGRALARARAARLSESRLARHARRISIPDPSHAREWPHLRALLARLEVLEGGFAVDLAAGDGITSSCTLPLFRDHGWRGLAVECDPVRYALLSHAYRRFPGVALCARRVTPANVVATLRDAGVPRDFEVLNLDLDSCDLAIAAALLPHFRPRLVDLEINEKIPPPVRFAVRYTPDFQWDEGHCYGCSLSAAHDVLGRAGYRLEGLRYNNAFFVRADAAERAGVTGLGPEEAYRTGYAERPDRRLLFPWNADVEELLTAPPGRVVSRLRERFARTPADFVLQTEPLDAAWTGDVEAAP